jgi:hypothetical protein
VLHAVFTQLEVVPMTVCELHKFGPYSRAFPELTIMLRFSNAGDTIMHVSQITRAPVASMREINELQRSATNRDVQIQRGRATVRPSKSRAISVSSEREQCGHPNTTTSGSLEEYMSTSERSSSMISLDVAPFSG